MNMTKVVGFFAAGILAASLSGCVNPVSSVPVEAKEADASIDGPLTVTLSIGKDGSSRNFGYVGPDENKIQFGGLRNITELIVVDTTDPNDQKIVSFSRALKQSSDETSATLQVYNIAFNKTYAFMVLMGY